VLARIERINLILAALVTCLAGALWGVRGAVAAGVGAALACADFWLLVRIGGRLVASARAGNPSRGLSFLLVGKTMALFALVFIAIAVAHLDAIPFALGFSVFVVSIFMLGLKAGMSEPDQRQQGHQASQGNSEA
jgi:ATP synthase I chain